MYASCAMSSGPTAPDGTRRRRKRMNAPWYSFASDETHSGAGANCSTRSVMASGSAFASLTRDQCRASLLAMLAT